MESDGSSILQPIEGDYVSWRQGGTSSCIDYILVSEGLLKESVPTIRVLNRTFTLVDGKPQLTEGKREAKKTKSDHSMLIADVQIRVDGRRTERQAAGYAWDLECMKKETNIYKF